MEEMECAECIACKSFYHRNCISPNSEFTIDGALICCLNISTKKGRKRAAESILAPARLLRSNKNTSSTSPIETGKSSPSAPTIPDFLQSFIEKQDKFLDHQARVNAEVNMKLDKLLNIGEKVVQLEQIVTTLQSQMATVMSSNAKLGYDMFSSDLVVSGFPETFDENLTDITSKIASCLDIVMEAKDIISATRIPYPTISAPRTATNSAHTSTSTTGPVTAPGGQPSSNWPRPFLTRLSNPFLRTSFIRAMRVKKSIIASSVNPTLPNTRFYINEHLSTGTLDLLKKARSLTRNDPNKSIYIYRGIVNYRPSKQSPATEILSENDLYIIN